MPSRRGSQKVKTGCRTCKARKIKCDEAKPVCRRCSAAGRQCGGYAAGDGGLAWYRPRQLTAHDAQEGRAFQFFAVAVGPVLAGWLDTYFWTHLVLQFSHFEPAVRHAVIAISALYADFQGGVRVMRRCGGNVFALQHYGASLRQLRATADAPLALLVCVLFICIEYLQGDVTAAARHCQHGIDILNRLDGGTWVREHVRPIFKRLVLLPLIAGNRQPKERLAARPSSLFPPAHQIPLVLGPPTPVSYPSLFGSMPEALAALDEIMTEVQVLRHTRDPVQRQRLQASLSAWHVSAVPFNQTSPTATAAENVIILYMRMKYGMARICLAMVLESDETLFDQYLDIFQAMVDSAGHAAQFKSVVPIPADVPQPSFTFETGFLPLLVFVIKKCRHLPTRRNALARIADLSVAKEGLFDVGTMYRIGQRLIQIEHGIALDGGTSKDDVVDVWPSIEERVLEVQVDHELEVVVGDDGAVTYRRQAWFMMRDASGIIFAREEHITDYEPSQGQGRIPNMRCALPEKPSMRA